MATINQNFEMWQGEDKRITFTILDSDGLPKSLSGARIDWVLLTWETGVVSKSTTLNNILVVDNSAQIILDSVDTKSVRCGKYKHECRITDVNNLSEVVSTGFVTINESTTI